MKKLLLYSLVLIGSLFCAIPGIAAPPDTLFPAVQNPPRLVNDFAGVLTAEQVGSLESKMLDLERTSSTQISIVTVSSIGQYDMSAYGTELYNRWKIGQSKTNNGVLIIAAIGDHKANISVGRGLEGALTDLESGRIIRNIIAPAFRQGSYYEGLDKASDAVITAVQGEYKAESEKKSSGGRGGISILVIIILIVVIISKIGGGGGGSYMSGRGNRGFGGGFLGGAILGGMLGRGGGGGWGGGGGFGGGGGGFGGFGGGSSGGGGASGSW